MYGKNHVKLFQNDYQIISSVVPKAFNQTKKGYKSVGRIALYAEIIQEQLEAGAPIEGIGFQSLNQRWINHS